MSAASQPASGRQKNANGAAGGANYLLRAARREDIDSLRTLIRRSAHGLSGDHYSHRQVEAALDGVFGVDSRLIDDQTYFIVEADGEPVACGGWSFRATLYGSDDIPGRDPRILEAASEAARIRAFFVHPAHARRGLGTMILERCEAAARTAGFHQLELGATLPGLPFYQARGYRAGTPHDHLMDNGLPLRIVPMSKTLE